MQQIQMRFAGTLLIAILILMASCNKDATITTHEAGAVVRLDQMEVGQKSRYVALSGEKYYSGEDQYHYTHDTLELEIIAKDDNGFLVEERLIYSGELGTWLDYKKEEAIQYYLTLKNDTLKIHYPGTPNLYSRIFGFQIIRQGLPMAPFGNNKMEIKGWKTNQGYIESRLSGYVEDYSLFGQKYDRLNVLIENSAMALDGNGETYVYNASKGLVRFSTYSWWTSDGYGWDLLP